MYRPIALGVRGALAALAVFVAASTAPGAARAEFLECPEADLFVERGASTILAQERRGDGLIGVWCADIEFVGDSFPYRGELRIWRTDAGALRSELEVIYVISGVENRVVQDIAVGVDGGRVTLVGSNVQPLVGGVLYVEDAFVCEMRADILDCAASDVAGDTGRAFFQRASRDGRPGRRDAAPRAPDAPEGGGRPL